MNPYKFGMIGSTDAHTGLVAIEEENFFGKTAPQEPSPERLTKTFFADPKTGIKIMDWEVGASGYAAVWATENTREALFDAMERRETYATTGTRMVVRFFGGWDFDAKDAHDRMPARVGYAKGVPMGGDLSKAPAGKAPTFLVAALKDPIGANLDRIQVVKGWVDAKGEVQEKVYDVAWSGDRKPDPKTGKVPSVGSTVDVANATWTNSIGAPELIAVWKDPALRPGPARLLLRPRDRDPDAALDGLRREALRHQAAPRHPDDDHRAGLHVADLVHAELIQGRKAGTRSTPGTARPAARGPQAPAAGRGGQ